LGDTLSAFALDSKVAASPLSIERPSFSAPDIAFLAYAARASLLVISLGAAPIAAGVVLFFNGSWGIVFVPPDGVVVVPDFGAALAAGRLVNAVIKSVRSSWDMRSPATGAFTPPRFWPVGVNAMSLK
jgi:hypothetical protein